MVRLILTERLKAACQLALPSLPPSPSRTEIEAALAPPTEEELKYKDYLAEKAKKDLEAKKKNAVNLDAIPTIGEAPKTPDADEEEPGLLPPPPRTLSHKAVKALSEFLLNNVCQGSWCTSGAISRSFDMDMC